MPDSVSLPPSITSGVVAPSRPPVAPAGQLQVRSRAHGLIQILELAGECDLASVEVLREALDANSGDLVVDLTAVTFFDAGSAGLLLAAAHRSRVVVAGSIGITARLLDLLVPRAVLPRYTTVAAALEALAGAGPGLPSGASPVAATGQSVVAHPVESL